MGEFAATKPQLTRGRRITKALPYVAVLVFVAGGIAFLIAYFGNTSHVKNPSTRPGNPVDASKVAQTVPLPKEARAVAGKYITSAMTRQNLPLSWKLTHPSLKHGFTYKQWLTGSIPVQYFPPKDLAGATYKVEWSHPNDVMMDVYIFAKPNHASMSEAFFIELKPVGTGAHKQWLVSYVAPNGGAQDRPADPSAN